MSRLTLPMVAPPLPHVDGLSSEGANLVVMRALANNGDGLHAVEHDEGEVRQVDLMNLLEDLLPHAWIRCRQFLLVEGIQGRVAVEGNVLSMRWDLVARKQGGIVGVVAKADRELGDVIPARYGACGR